MYENHLSIDEVQPPARKLVHALTNSVLLPSKLPLRLPTNSKPRLRLFNPEAMYSFHDSRIFPLLIEVPVTPSHLPAKATDIPLPPSSPFPDLHPEHPLPTLIRATNGKTKDNKKRKIKLSTVVQADELEGFYTKYAEVCKVGMSGLKKRDRSGRRAKEKKKRKGKKEAEVDKKV